MYRLLHFPLCPFSREVRVLLKEKDISFEMEEEYYWQRSKRLMKLNPAVEVPVLLQGERIVLCDIAAIYEYIEEVSASYPLLGREAADRAEVRRIIGWFNGKFYQEVTRYIVNERVIRFYTKQGEPQSDAIRAAKANIYYHLDYIAFLLRKRNWLAGNSLTLADIAAACQLSVLDYLGDVPWEHNTAVKDWYALMKSRPSFRTLLSDRISGFAPAKHYANPDF